MNPELQRLEWSQPSWVNHPLWGFVAMELWQEIVWTAVAPCYDIARVRMSCVELIATRVVDDCGPWWNHRALPHGFLHRKKKAWCRLVQRKSIEWRFAEIGVPLNHIKSSILIRISIIMNHPFWETPHDHGSLHIHPSILVVGGCTTFMLEV